MPFQYPKRSNDYSSVGQIFSGAAADLYTISQEYSWDPSEIITNEMKRRARLDTAKTKAEGEVANYALELDARLKSLALKNSGKSILNEATRKAGGLAALGEITTKSANDYLRLKNKEKPESFDLSSYDKAVDNFKGRITAARDRITELENPPPTISTTSSLPFPILEGSNVTYEDGKYTVPLVDFGKHLRDNIGLRVLEHSEFGGVTPGVHTDTSYHHVDNAIDIQDWRDDNIDGVFWKTRTSNLGNLLKGSGVEVLHPGNEPTEHGTHVHLAGHDGKIILNADQFKQLYTEGNNRSVF